MPETRYIEEYNYPKDLPASEKTVANAQEHGWIKRIAYEVSDEQLDTELEAEARERAIQKITELEKAEIIAERLIIKD